MLNNCDMTDNENLNNKRIMFGQSERDYSVDLMRSISCLLVVVTHACSFLCQRIPYDDAVGVTGEWLSLATLKCISVSATNLFLMISGIFFLSPERQVSISKIWSKNILKLAIAFVLWCMIYAAVRITYINGGEFEGGLFWQETLLYEFHLWYIPMMLGIYVIVPIMREITARAQRKIYIYIIWLMIGAMTLNTINTLCTQFPGTTSENVIRVINDTPTALICQYPFYCILGYFLYTYRPKLKMRLFLYVLGIIGVLSLTWVTTFFYVETGDPNPYLIQGKFEIYVLAKNTALFVLVLSVFSKVRWKKVAKVIISKVSGATLFIYLSHLLCLNAFIHEEWLLDSGYNLFWIACIYILITYVEAFLFSLIFLQLIPWTYMRNIVLDTIWPNRRIWNGGRKKKQKDKNKDKDKETNALRLR